MLLLHSTHSSMSFALQETTDSSALSTQIRAIRSSAGILTSSRQMFMMQLFVCTRYSRQAASQTAVLTSTQRQEEEALHPRISSTAISQVWIHLRSVSELLRRSLMTDVSTSSLRKDTPHGQRVSVRISLTARLALRSLKSTHSKRVRSLIRSQAAVRKCSKL